MKAFFTIYGYITNSKWDDLPVNLIHIAQLVEHWIGITKVVCSDPIEAWIFLGINFTAAWIAHNYNVNLGLHSKFCVVKHKIKPSKTGVVTS